MKKLYEPFRIKNLEIKNRFVRSATVDKMAESNGQVSDALINFYSELAEGGVGLIISGASAVQYKGTPTPICQNSLAGDEYVEGWKKLIDAVHERGAKIAIQLVHGGRVAKPNKPDMAMGPSFIENDPYFASIDYTEFTEDEIWQTVHSFGDAALRAKEAGADAVQIHGAHKVLFAQFLSPFTNRRQDRWGGSLKNRLRLHYEVYQDIRKKVGDDYPVLIKFGVQDGFSGGLEFTEGKEAAKLLAQMGFDSLEISQGLSGVLYEGTEFKTQINDLSKEAYYRDWTREIKGEIDIPVMMVGGLRTFSLMEEIVEKEEADLIALCRPLICEPDLINAWRTDKAKKAKCISCNKCLDVIKSNNPLHCPLTKAEK